MNTKKLKTQLILAAVSVAVLLAAITVGTVAWFTFNAATNIEPVGSSISKGDASLLIADRQDGDFDRECTLVLDMNPDTLRPISTANLDYYSAALGQNQSGITVSYRDVTSSIADYLMHGMVYLKSESGANDVYFDPDAIQIGSDEQSMAALRLGMRITIAGQATQYIFRMDGMLAGTADQTRTIPEGNSVVESLEQGGTAEYVRDPSVAISDYMALVSEEENVLPEAGEETLCTLEEDQIASVEYWIYLEGCDENCVNSLQSRNVPVQLAFAGVPKEENE